MLVFCFLIPNQRCRYGPFGPISGPLACFLGLWAPGLESGPLRVSLAVFPTLKKINLPTVKKKLEIKHLGLFQTLISKKRLELDLGKVPNCKKYANKLAALVSGNPAYVCNTHARIITGEEKKRSSLGLGFFGENSLLFAIYPRFFLTTHFFLTFWPGQGPRFEMCITYK